MLRSMRRLSFKTLVRTCTALIAVILMERAVLRGRVSLGGVATILGQEYVPEPADTNVKIAMEYLTQHTYHKRTLIRKKLKAELLLAHSKGNMTEIKEQDSERQLVPDMREKFRNDTLLYVRAVIRARIKLRPDQPAQTEASLLAHLHHLAGKSSSFIRYQYKKVGSDKQMVSFEMKRQRTRLADMNLSEPRLLHNRKFYSDNGRGGEGELCPLFPDTLEGFLPATYGPATPLTASDVIGQHPDLDLGGRHAPEGCVARQRVAVLVPYRDRPSHLHIMLGAVITVLKRQQLEFAIFVIEQEWPTIFNRGLLLNAGFKEAMALGDFDCIVFHDVDLLPLNDACLYRCANVPLHIRAVESKFNFQLTWSLLFGGIVSYTPQQFRRVNGFSNLYFGWGSEDDDLRSRSVAKGLPPERYPTDLCCFDMLHHERDPGNGKNEDRMKLQHAFKARMETEGLNSVRYTVTETTVLPTYTWIKVKVNMTDVLTNVSPDVQKMLPHLSQVADSNSWLPEALQPS